jgi:hypothetical protein
MTPCRPRRAKACYTNNWEITPVGQAYRDVVFGKYWTDEEGATDPQGEYLVRAFKGTHEIVAALGLVQSRVTASFVNDTTIVIRLVPDRQAPTQPKNLKATHTATTATLTWDASVDNVKVIGYDVYKGTAKVNAEDVMATTYKVTGLTPATLYSFTVVAKDTAGNRSPASAAITLTTDSVKLSLASICSVNPLQTRRWEVRSTFDVPVTYRWAVNGTLLAGTGTVEPNGIAYFTALPTSRPPTRAAPTPLRSPGSTPTARSNGPSGTQACYTARPRWCWKTTTMARLSSTTTRA